MGNHPTSFQGDILTAVREAIEGKLPEARAEVTGGGGHYNIAVTSPVFAGKSKVESHRLVLSAIAHLMKGDDAPVHAVDSLTTKTS